ncbi:MAG: GUN4 domain-containing protein [Prochloraceae cyanobacterium]
MNDTQNPDNTFNTQLSQIQTQLSQLSTQLAEIKEQVNPIPTLSQRVSQLEENLLLLSDISLYEKLRDFLAAGRWFEADIETTDLIAIISGQPNLEELKPAQIRKFPCHQLQIIDRLWLTYSQERFGFSVQLHIYQELGGNIETTIEQNRKLIEKWGSRLGWRENNVWKKCDQLDYSLNAPVGCHPSRWWNSPYGSKMTNYFLSRLMTCKL